MAAIPRGLEYWKLLAAVINHEPVLERDRFFTAMSKPLGIEKGKPFEPDTRQLKILSEAALVGEAMAKANTFDKRFEGSLYRPQTHWHCVISLNPTQEAPNYSQVDERAAYFYEGVLITNAMISKTPGVGQAYLGAYRDKNGRAFAGGKNCSLHVPADPPAQQFWSVTIYDADTRAIIQNEEHVADRSSRQPDLIKNPDGSVDLYFGPVAPEGLREELDSDSARPKLVYVVSPLRAPGSLLR